MFQVLRKIKERVCLVGVVGANSKYIYTHRFQATVYLEARSWKCIADSTVESEFAQVKYMVPYSVDRYYVVSVSHHDATMLL